MNTKIITAIGFLVTAFLMHSENVLSQGAFNSPHSLSIVHNTIHPLEIVKEENVTMLFWNIPHPYSEAFILFYDPEGNTAWSYGLNGKRAGNFELNFDSKKINLSFSLVVDNLILASYTSKKQAEEKEELPVLNGVTPTQ